jgi:hypothetical protein
MVLLNTRDYESVDYEQSMNSHSLTVLARKRTGSYARFIMTNETFTNWMRGDGGKHRASIQELHWGFTSDTEQSLKDELDIETESDIESRHTAEMEQISITIPATPAYVPLSFVVPGQEASLARHDPTTLMSFHNGAGHEVAYIDREGNYVKVGAPAPAPPPPAPEPIVPPDVSGRIIDLE